MLAWQRLGRVTGVAGLAAVVLIFVVLVGSREQPPFTAAADEFLTHYRVANTVASVAPWFGQGGGGIQYEFDQSIAELIEGGFLKAVGR